MTPSMQTIMQFMGLKPSLFAANSRYQGIDTATLIAADGSTMTYLRRRFLPQPANLAQVQQHSVVQGDRLDVLAARYFGDAELFWRICDANGGMRPEDLTATAGQSLRIAMPEGIPGAPNVP
jgi:hypothetical protein